jgi:hypothetical protein
MSFDADYRPNYVLLFVYYEESNFVADHSNRIGQSSDLHGKGRRSRCHRYQAGRGKIHVNIVFILASIYFKILCLFYYHYLYVIACIVNYLWCQHSGWV